MLDKGMYRIFGIAGVGVGKQLCRSINMMTSDGEIIVEDFLSFWLRNGQNPRVRSRVNAFPSNMRPLKFP